MFPLRKITLLSSASRRWPCRLKSSVCTRAVNLAYSYYEPNNPATSVDAPVIILHGLLGSKRNWHSLSQIISKRSNLNVYAVDQRNHGETPHTEEMDYDVLAEDILAFAEQQKLSKISLIGHSMGGRAAIKFTLNNPDRVEKLVVVDVSQVTKSPTASNVPGVLAALLNLDLSHELTLSSARRLAEEALIPVCESKPVRLFLCANLIQGTNGKFSWRFNAATIRKIFRENLAKFTEPVKGKFNGPTLFVGGGQSDYIVPGDHDRIEENFPSARFEYVAHAGHFVHSEKPTEFLDVLLPFLGRGVEESGDRICY